MILGDIFITNMGFLKLYKYYINNFGGAFACNKKCCEKSPRYKAYLKDHELRPCMKKMLLQDFLVAPVQRVMRYGMLLQELLKVTPKKHPEYAELSRATDYMKHIADYMNERKRESENMEAFSSFISEIRGLTKEIPSSPQRALVRSGTMEMNKDRVMFSMFTDMAFFTTMEKKHGTYKLKAMFLLAESEVIPNGDTSFIIKTKKEKLVCSFSEPSERKDWYDTVHSAIEAAKDDEKLVY